MKMNNINFSLDTLLTARMNDYLALLLWTKTKDAEKGKNMPKSIFEMLVGSQKEKEEGFRTIEEYKNARNEFLKKGDGTNGSR